MSNPIPEYANLIWVSKTQVHIAVPTHSGEPYVLSCPRSVEGLASALGILSKQLIPQSPTAPGSEPKPPPKLNAQHKAIRRPAIYTEEQRAKVRELMKKAGLI